MNNLIDIICSCCCLFYCLLHSFINMFSLKKFGKRVDLICEKCGSGISQADQVGFVLSDVQVKALYEFVKSLKEVDLNGSK